MYQFFFFPKVFRYELIECFIHHHVAIWLSGEKPNVVSTEMCDRLQVVTIDIFNQPLGPTRPGRPSDGSAVGTGG